MKSLINFEKATFKDFENVEGLDAFERAELFSRFTDYMENTKPLTTSFCAFLSIAWCDKQFNYLYQNKLLRVVNVLQNIWSPSFENMWSMLPYFPQ